MIFNIYLFIRLITYLLTYLKKFEVTTTKKSSIYCPPEVQLRSCSKLNLIQSQQCLVLLLDGIFRIKLTNRRDKHASYETTMMTVALSSEVTCKDVMGPLNGVILITDKSDSRSKFIGIDGCVNCHPKNVRNFWS